ncbi:hypothetical protein ACE7GA_01880 [Roseomonas sp. CCTCC AB2023176]|uniref:hypothetical protein n=1 Tax=Roseomonas sp. CCTCC AB2023176 TaxID=3342640 RepID=UPI0035DC9FC0
MADELRRTFAEVQLLTQAGRYRSAVMQAGMDVGAQNAPPGVRCLNFNLVQGDGTRTGDSVCVTIRQGRFVKTRVTSWQPPEPVVAGLAAMAFLDGVLRTGVAGL